MRMINLFLCAIAFVSLIVTSEANPLQDPIADYLAMQVPERSDYVGTLQFIRRVKIDVDGDGEDEVLIGTSYRYSGAKHDFNWSGYTPVQGGYQRITPANADVQVSSFETVFAGLLEEVTKQGLATAGDIEVDSPQSGNVTKVGTLRFYYLTDGQLVVEEREALDLAIPAQKATYERYFGKNRVTRTATIESFSRQQLQEMGYAIPSWEPPSP